MVCSAVPLNTIHGDQVEIIKRLKFVNSPRRGNVHRVVVDEPACDVGVQCCWYGIEKILI